LDSPFKTGKSSNSNAATADSSTKSSSWLQTWRKGRLSGSLPQETIELLPNAGGNGKLRTEYEKGVRNEFRSNVKSVTA